jgi:hypothetical protein
MGHDRPRWRFRLSNLMLLVVIATLATYIVVERRQRVQEVRRLAAERQWAGAAARQQMVAAFRQVEAERARARARLASPPAQAGASPAADK